MISWTKIWIKDDGKYYTILKVCPLKKTSDKEEESWEEMKSNSGKEEKLKSGKEIKSGKGQRCGQSRN